MKLYSFTYSTFLLLQRQMLSMEDMDVAWLNDEENTSFIWSDIFFWKCVEATKAIYSHSAA